MGVTEREVSDLLARWPIVKDGAATSTACLAINNALNEVAHGLHFSKEAWFPVTRSQVAATYDRWAPSRG